MQDSSNGVEVVIVVLAVAAFLVVVSFVVSFLSGWRKLAGQFTSAGKMPPKSVFLMRATFRTFFEYRNMLLANADTGGLWLKFWPRIAHPTLYIPWGEIAVSEVKTFLFFKTRIFTLGQTQRVNLRLRNSYAEQLLTRARAAGPSAPPLANTAARPESATGAGAPQPAPYATQTAQDRASLGLPPEL